MKNVIENYNLKMPKAILLLIALIAAAFIILPLKNILLGLYNWHIRQPETIHGVIELAVLFLVELIFIIKLKKASVIMNIIIIGTLLYMQNHQALIPMIAAVCYFEMIIAIGYSTRSILNISFDDDSFSYLIDFGIGVAVWGTGAIIISLLGFGTFNYLRLLTVCLFAIFVIIKRRKPLFLYLKESSNKLDKKSIVILTMLIILVLIQCAKSARAFDYDSLWYGLRPQQVLIGEHSFYDNLGMLEWVNYFPKLFELFFAPLSNLHEYSFIYSCNIMVYILLIILINTFFVKLNFSKHKSLFYTLVIVSIPVIGNMSSTAKPDLMGSFFVVLSTLLFYNSYKKMDYNYGLIAMAMLAISLGGKINVYLYSFMGFIGGVLLLCFYVKNDGGINEVTRKLFNKKIFASWLIVLLSIFVLIGVTYRTYKLTGYPLYPFTVDFWKKLGFTGVYPFEDYFGGRKSGFNAGTEFNLRFYIKHIYNLLFNPNNIAQYRENHIAIAWYSNIGVFIFIIDVLALILLKIKKIKNKIFNTDLNVLSILCLPIILVMAYVSVFEFPFAQDGNYYLVPIIVGIIYLVCVFETFPIVRKDKKIIYLIFCIFMVLDSAIGIVSHTSWSWGTGCFKINLINTGMDSEKCRKNALTSESLYELEEYIEKQNYEVPRSIGIGYTQKMFELSAGYEDVQNSYAMTKGIFDTEENLIKYLKWSNINYIIIPKDDVEINGLSDNWKEDYSTVWNVYNKLLKENGVVEIESQKYRMIDITSFTS